MNKTNSNDLLFEGKNFLFTQNALEGDKSQMAEKIQNLGGNVLARYLKKLNYIVATEEDKKDPPKKLKQAMGWKDTSIVGLDFIEKCIDEDKIIANDEYLILSDDTVSSIKRALSDAEDDDKVSKINKVTILDQNTAKKAVDELCCIRSQVSVYLDDNILFDVMLNQTNLGHNNNKFFALQLLVDTKNNYYVWTRWGRVGANGQSSLDKFSQNLDKAIDKFTSKFFAKSGNEWQSLPYSHVTGKYFIMERDYEDDDDSDKGINGAVKSKDGNLASKPVAESKLDPRVYGLVKNIFDLKMMNDSMSQFSYDTKKMPLGKLTKDHIKKSMQVLKDIAEELANPLNRHSKLEELSSLFYTIIPHAYGMRRPPIIATKELLKNKLELVESLAEIQIANSLMKKVDEIDSNVNPIDSKYNALNNNIKPLDKKGKEFELIKEYIENTHGSSHNYFDLNVEDAFELVRNGENENFKEFESLHNRKLLWHGSGMSNFVGILSQGLRIAPPEAPVSGYAFGKGVYFADIVSKSAGYCRSHLSNNEALMLLCEVALGDELELKNPDYNAAENAKTNNKHCTKGLGQVYPDPKEDYILENNTIVPKGKPISSNNNGNWLFHNEYIVYNTSQIKMKYLIKIKFDYNKH